MATTGDQAPNECVSSRIAVAWRRGPEWLDMQVVSVNMKIQGGLPCFSGTRVPVSSLFDHLRKGYTVDQFLEDFPTVTKAQVDALLELAEADVPRYAAPAGRE
jgi:uncharacterized protein (DUF433 family)